MGSPAGLDPVAIIGVLSIIRTANNAGISALAFLVFDHLLTFAQEVDLFWKPKLTGAAGIFLLNRYIVLGTMLLNVSGVVFTVPPKDNNTNLDAESCAPLVITTNVFAMLQYIPWAVFAAKRAFALSSKNLPFTTFILVLSLVPIGAAISHFVFGLDGQSDPTFGCVVVDPIDPVLSQRCAYPFLQVHIIPRFHLTVCLVTVISRACLIVADALLVLATWATVSRTVRMGIFTTGDMPTFGAVLLRNGALYFLVLFFLNSLHLTLTVLSVSEIAFQNASFVLQFVHPITGILVSHFLLDLQSTNRAVMHMDTISTQQADTIIFDRAVFTLENATSYGSFKDAGSHMSKSMDLNDRSSVYSVRGLDPVAEGSDQESRIPRWKVLVV